MILRDTTDVTCEPAAIFAFFEDMESHYLGWHPDHRLFRWVAGRGLAVGNVFYFEETIGGKLLKKNVVFTRIEAYSHIEFAPTFWLMRLFLPRLLFRIEGAAPSGCRLVAEIHLRMGPLAARFNRRGLDAVRDHMRVEGVNLKRIVENQIQSNHASIGADTRVESTTTATNGTTRARIRQNRVSRTGSFTARE